MTLRARLTLFFVGIVVIPLLLAALALRAVVSAEAERRTNTRLSVAALAVESIWSERLAAAAREVGLAAEQLGPSPTDPELENLRMEADLDFLILSTPSGEVTASAMAEPIVAAGGPPPAPETLTDASIPAQRARVPVVGATSRVLTGGWYADDRVANHLRQATGLRVAVVDEGRVIASAGSIPGPIPGPSASPVQVDDSLGLLVPVGEGGGGVLLVARVGGGIGPLVILLVVLAGLVVATLLAAVLARLIAQPLQRLAEGARAVAAGDLNTRVEVPAAGDVARVARAFNTMTANLRAHVAELERSRDELRRGLERYGATLTSTLDLGGMLDAVLETAAANLRAEAGAVFLLAPSSRELKVDTARGYQPPSDAVLPVGEGIGGRAALGGRVLVPANPEASSLEPAEPQASTAVAVPLVRGDRVIGVIALYGRSIPDPFDDEDAGNLATFAAQASVAIENVFLHRETERLSITDGLTGAWNRRYLELTLRKEIERAQRFDRPLSVLMVDIDRFKEVNDACGHRRGDTVLVEITQRMSTSIRAQIDVLARYGGEEFVVVLPETPAEGAVVVAEKIREAIRSRPFTSEYDPDLWITVSVGVGSLSDRASDVGELIGEADEAMYRAKQGGRDKVVTPRAG